MEIKKASMKKVSIIILIYSFSLIAFSQSEQWVYINDTVNNLTFNMPEIPIYIDTLNTELYSCILSSTIGIEAHIYDSAMFNINDTVFNQILLDEGNDTLRTIAKLILFATKSDVTQITNIETNGVSGIELGFSYNSLASDEQMHSFIRYYLFENKFISFSVTGFKSEMLRSVNTKNSFFNSINFQ